MKLKICELATGNKFTEEWTFLSEDQKHHFRGAQLRIKENFALLFSSYGILMLNLVTRKQFLVERENILNQMVAKVPVGEAEDLPERIEMIATRIGKMIIGRNKIEVPCSFLMNHVTVNLGSLKILNVTIFPSHYSAQIIFKL